MKYFSLKPSEILAHLLGLLILTNYIFDGINKFLLVSGSDFNRIALIYRSFLFGLLFVMLIYQFNRDKLSVLCAYLILLSFFWVGNVNLIHNLSTDISLFEQFIYFNKYFYAIFAFSAFYSLRKYKISFRLAEKYFKVIVIVNSILVFAGIVWEIELFATVVEAFEFRFGYSGLIIAGNEASIFYVIAISFFYHKVYIEKSDDKINYILQPFDRLNYFPDKINNVDEIDSMLNILEKEVLSNPGYSLNFNTNNPLFSDSINSELLILTEHPKKIDKLNLKLIKVNYI